MVSACGFICLSLSKKDAQKMLQRLVKTHRVHQKEDGLYHPA